jgi:hypothetical protein
LQPTSVKKEMLIAKVGFAIPETKKKKKSNA